MKKLIIPFFSLVLISCTSNGGEGESDERNETVGTSEVDSTSGEEIIEEDLENDCTKEGLFGNVKMIAMHSYDVDEYGEEMGMGGFYDDITFDENGLITVRTSNGCCGAMSEEVTYKRDENGRLTHRIFKVAEPWEAISEDVPLDHKEKFFYDAEGVLVKIKIAGADSVLTEEHEYEYDKEGRVIEDKVYFVEDEFKYSIFYTYSDDQRVESYEYDDTERNYKIVFGLDENGLEKSKELYLSNGNIEEQKFSYEFDEQGNWTLKTIKYRYNYSDGTKDDWNLSYKESRTITYFE